MTRINPTNIDFEGLRDSFRDYLRDRNDLLDYDHDASIISLLYGVLSYNTSLNSIYGNLLHNEVHLDSAVIRNNAVSRANDLGYVSRTATGARAVVRLTVTPSGSPDTITIVRNTEFEASVDGRNVTFVLPEDATIQRNDGTYVKDLEIVQGIPLTHRFSSMDGARYILPNPLVEGASVSVVDENDDGNVIYERATDLIGVDRDSRVFFVQENEDGLVEVYFGDDVLGRKPTGSVAVSYRVTRGREGNGLRIFSINNPTVHDIAISTVTASQGGDDGEELISIKRNAPKAKRSRGRFLTTDDYRTAILGEFGDLSDVSIWGGAENDPPDSGAIYISVQPNSTDFLSTRQQDNIASFLRSRSVIDRRHTFVRPRHLFVVPTIRLRYDPTRTTVVPGDILTQTLTIVQNYEDDRFGNFGNSFYHSDFLTRLAKVNAAILSVAVDVRLQRRVTVTNRTGLFTVTFNNRIAIPSAAGTGIVSSSPFTFGDHENVRFDEDGEGKLRVRDLDGTIVGSNVGTVEYGKGVVRLNGFETDSTDPIRINVVPADVDVFGVRNQVLFFSDIRIVLIDQSTLLPVASLDGVTDGGRTALLDSDFQNETIF